MPRRSWSLKEAAKRKFPGTAGRPVAAPPGAHHHNLPHMGGDEHHLIYLCALRWLLCVSNFPAYSPLPLAL